jgi:hypothetical protein
MAAEKLPSDLVDAVIQWQKADAARSKTDAEYYSAEQAVFREVKKAELPTGLYVADFTALKVVALVDGPRIELTRLAGRDL